MLSATVYTAARNYYRMVELWLLTQKKKFVLKKRKVRSPFKVLWSSNPGTFSQS